jgi:hypothetical protein
MWIELSRYNILIFLYSNAYVNKLMGPFLVLCVNLKVWRICKFNDFSHSIWRVCLMFSVLLFRSCWFVPYVIFFYKICHQIIWDVHVRVVQGVKEEKIWGNRVYMPNYLSLRIMGGICMHICITERKTRSVARVDYRHGTLISHNVWFMKEMKKAID